MSHCAWWGLPGTSERAATLTAFLRLEVKQFSLSCFIVTWKYLDMTYKNNISACSHKTQLHRNNPQLNNTHSNHINNNPTITDSLYESNVIALIRYQANDTHSQKSQINTINTEKTNCFQTATQETKLLSRVLAVNTLQPLVCREI